MLTCRARWWFYGFCAALTWTGFIVGFWMIRGSWTAEQSRTFGIVNWLWVNCVQGATGLEWNWKIYAGGLLAMIAITLATGLACYFGCRVLVYADWLRDHCDGCGYPKTGIVGDCCPECGVPWRMETQSERLSPYAPGLGRSVMWRFVLFIGILSLAIGFQGVWNFIGDLKSIKSTASGGAYRHTSWPAWVPFAAAYLWLAWMLPVTYLRLRKLRAANSDAARASSA